MLAVKTTTLSCPLCKNLQSKSKFTNHTREFFECQICDLLFVNPAQFISQQEEKTRYDQHQNDADDAGYLAFLSRLKNALIPSLDKNMKGLDFGCGPSEAMSKLFLEEGYLLDRFDPNYAELPLIEQSYDFIICSEVVEHFKDPFEQFSLLKRLLKPSGLLAIMTGLRDEYREDRNWWYLRDTTHVSFYTRRSFEWLAEAFDLGINFPGDNLVLLEKKCLD